MIVFDKEKGSLILKKIVKFVWGTTPGAAWGYSDNFYPNRGGFRFGNGVILSELSRNKKSGQMS